MTRSARSAVPVPWQRSHTGPDGSTVVHRWIDTCNVIEELKARGADDVCEWWLLAGQYVGGPLLILPVPVFKLLRGQF